MFDCVMCRRDARTASQAVIRNAAAMLRPEGKYVIVSSAAPDERLPLFTFVNSPWASVEVRRRLTQNNRISSMLFCG